MSFLSPRDASSNSRFPRGSRASRRRLSSGAAALAAFGIAGTVAAQELPESARLLTLDLSTGLEWSDNPEFLPDGESRLISRTGLNFGLERRTGIDRLLVGLSGDLLLGRDLHEIEGPELRFSWSRDVRHARVAVEASVSEATLDTGTVSDDAPEGEDFSTVDPGTRRTTRLAVSGAFGVDRPLGGTYRISQERLRYFDTTDADLTDSNLTTFEAAITTRPNRRVMLDLTAALSETDEFGADGSDTRRTRLGTRLEAAITPTVTGRADLGWLRIEEDGETDTETTGVVFDGDLTWTRPNGTIALEYDSELETSGRRDTLRARRALALPRGALSYSLGLTRAEGFDVRPIYGINWQRDFPRARIVADFTQTPTTSSDDSETIVSEFTFSYTQVLTERGSFETSLSVLDSNELLDSEADSRRYGLDLAYRHRVTRDWSMVGRLSAVQLQQDDAEDRSATTIFIGLERRFAWN